jgi:hypothetical protein
MVAAGPEGDGPAACNPADREGGNRGCISVVCVSLPVFVLLVREPFVERSLLSFSD